MQKIFLLFFSIPLFLSAQIQTSIKSRAQILLEQHHQAIIEAQFPEESSIEPGIPISWGMEEETAIEEPDPEPTEEELERQRKADRLNRMFNNNNKGHVVKDPLSPNRTGNGGIGNNDRYWMNTGKPLYIPSPETGCNYRGVVVIKIAVNEKGQVFEAVLAPNNQIPSGLAKSNFGSNTCLVQKAKIAAKNSKWSQDQGNLRRVGFIVYRFELN